MGSHFVRFGYKGSADILGICPDGRFLAVECKKHKGGILSDEQKIFLSRIQENNGVAILANSLESMIEQLKKYKII